MAFSFIKTSLDRDREKWETIKIRNQINGKLGGRPTKNPKNPNGYKKTQKTQSNPKNPVSVSVSVSDSVSVNKNLSNDKLKAEPSFGNDLVNFVLETFESVFGFRATDRDVRRVAWNFVQRAKTEIKKFGHEATDERVKSFTSKFLNWVRNEYEHIEKLETAKLKLVKYLDLYGRKNGQK